MNFRFAFYVVAILWSGWLGCAGLSTSASQSEIIPADGALLCSGHVSGTPESADKPEPHILWQVYASNKASEFAIAFYREKFGVEREASANGCFLWRVQENMAERLYEVCPLAGNSPMPGENCPLPSPEVQTIIRVSVMMGSLGASEVL